MIRTSQTHPLEIAVVSGEAFSGALGVTLAPGKWDPGSASGGWARDLAADLDSIAAWQARVVVTLIELHEFDLLRIRSLSAEVRRRGMDWLHLPIRDVSIPDSAFEAAWPEHSAALRKRLAAGENVLVHCRGGLGRAGMIAARLLVDGGVDPEIAIFQVQSARPGAIETKPQENWVKKGARPGLGPRASTKHDNRRKETGLTNDRWRRSAAMAVSDPRYDRALGAFIGLAIGDALGTTIEFSPRDSYPPVIGMVGGGPFGLKPGEWTDDTSMALCLADSLIASRGTLDAADLAQRFVRWQRNGENSVTGRCFDIGVTTRTALETFRRTGTPVGDRAPRSAGNGGIMRLAPAAIVAGEDLDKAAALGRAQSEVTHATEECLAGADLLARLLSAGIAGKGLDALRAAEHAKFEAPNIEAIARGAWRGKRRDEIRSSGYVVHTLEAACWAVGSSGTFADAVLNAVNLGDDADTVGAVTGQIAGAIWGYASIPNEWKERLAWRDRLISAATALWELSITG
jgi:ADP-ribosyl-[dinitrogen reductase] hydrolase